MASAATDRHSAYNLRFATIAYRWHPLFGRTLQVSPFRRGKDLKCIYTDVRPDLCRELPTWMFDDIYCTSMSLGAAEVGIEGLNSLSELLAVLGKTRKRGARSRSSKKENDGAVKAKSKAITAGPRAGTPKSPSACRAPDEGLIEALADLLLEAPTAKRRRRREAVMSSRITPDHLGRSAVVYVRQSTMAQVTGNLESQRRQYDLAGAAQTAGFISVTVIDDDLGRSGSGSVQRPGFERLDAMVCSGDVGAVYCIEASRLARNGRDWHHLIDLCALAGTLVIDPTVSTIRVWSTTVCCSASRGRCRSTS